MLPLVRRRREGGQAMAEFAMVAALFFLMLFGVIQIGLLMASQNGLVNGVRDAARRAATYRVSDQSFVGGTIFGAVCDAVSFELTNGKRLPHEIIAFQASRLSYTIQYEWIADPTAGEYSLIARVDATYNSPIWVPLVGIFIHPSDPSVFPLSASEQMRVENPPLNPSDTSTQTC